MSYCHERGISHSHYHGGPRMWEPEDRSKNLAYSLEKALLCSRCGTAEWETDQDPYAYEAVVEYCRVCHLRDVAQEQNKDQTGSGQTIVMLPKKVAAALRARGPKARPSRADRRRQA